MKVYLSTVNPKPISYLADFSEDVQGQDLILGVFFFWQNTLLKIMLNNEGFQDDQFLWSNHGWNWRKKSRWVIYRSHFTLMYRASYHNDLWQESVQLMPSSVSSFKWDQDDDDDDHQIMALDSSLNNMVKHLQGNHLRSQPRRARWTEEERGGDCFYFRSFRIKGNKDNSIATNIRRSWWWASPRMTRTPTGGRQRCTTSNSRLTGGFVISRGWPLHFVIGDVWPS